MLVKQVGVCIVFEDVAYVHFAMKILTADFVNTLPQLQRSGFFPGNDVTRRLRCGQYFPQSESYWVASVARTTLFLKRWENLVRFSPEGPRTTKGPQGPARGALR